ncbi:MULTISPECIES: DUF6488 family protein [unclassified Oleiphilus]|jgi:hypothetical protein|nr:MULTISPECIES: DUF6488 family protein [unclassified Oleiphilus]KZY45756.1 hypothetical protein A3732_09470 [Oleiphilus sp. HI0050]KZY74284.1 hypothetical protein A3740_02845 [Oleiphilus sp. HI0068]KZY81216.1 hypothetical protein A3741_17575 [Oleiphilus sp. HI0069]KZZ16707.1 hypothetical protein A3749_23265 [Oleiphilus sp. HI0078]KZZ19481.1 hypothetical protein A3752_14420 [Oleiphilus sp. HI0081]KZZ32534.1 hypothetical protein A3755_09545 [Oleiphilus sp. HI0085]
MKYLISAPLILVMFLFGQTALAGPGSGHSHGHQHKPITSEQAINKATKHVWKLAKKGKIDASWSSVTSKSVEEKSFGHGPEWVVTFENESIEDPKKQTLYVFFTINGKYLASNFTGQ